MFQRNGLSVLRTYFVHGTNRHLLDTYVDRLGGYPVVIKLLGYSRGLGVMRADPPESLYSVIDFAHAEGTAPLLCACPSGRLYQIESPAPCAAL